MDSNLPIARARYDIETGDLIEVMFGYDPAKGLPAGYIEIPYSTAMAFFDGNIKMIDHTVVMDEYSELVVVRKTEIEYKRSFWELCDAESDASPITVFDKSAVGFRAKLSKLNQRFLLYVTERNDPNKLLMIIKTSELDADHEGNLFCPLDLDVNYSIYVRNHAA